MRADLENWKGVRQDWDSMHADRCPYGSHPIYCEDFWAGVEFVAAFNEYGKDGFVLRSRPGGKPLGGQWLPLHSTVVGVAERGQVRNAFLRYIDDVRLAAPRMTCCYNSWWTLPKGFKEDNLLALAKDFKERLFDRHRVFFDVFAIDAGWTDRQSIWEIDRQSLPHGFDDLRRIVESAGGRLGLWMSPSSIYPQALDYDWAQRSGLTVIKQPTPWGGAFTGVSLADPNYRQKTREHLQRLIRENRFAHIKFDGFIASENAPHHDLLPGADSVEPLAEHAMELIAAAKQADPSLVTEPTFLNSWATYITPWNLKYADTIFGNSGGDYPRASGPAPDYRESCTNAREWYIFSSLNEIWLPQNALQYFDIIHCDAAAGFANHVAMAIGRGRFFLPVYVNPKYLSDDDLASFAGLVRWARGNQAILRNTVVLPSRVEQGEPYAYAHWLAKRAVVAIRNPSNESRTYTLDLHASGAPADLTDAVCYTLYPYRRGVATAINGASKVPIALAPWELLFVEIVPRSELREPVAVGARWYCGAEGKMRVAADPGVEQVQVLQPGGGTTRRAATAAPSAAPSGKVLSHALTQLPKADWLKVKGKALPTSRFDLECTVSLPAGAAKGKVLLLLEYPGRQHVLSTCTATVNGRETRLEQSSSADHIGYAGGTHGFNPKSYWAGLIPYASEWTWHICPVGAGESRVRFTGAVAMPKAKTGVWVWSDSDRSAREQALGIPCSKPEMPQLQDRLDRQGVCIKPPVE